MILYGTLIALAVLCVLLWIWGSSWRHHAQYNERAIRRARIDIRRAESSAHGWRVKATRLQDIVDRVEG